jgi:hypothetical protein
MPLSPLISPQSASYASYRSDSIYIKPCKDVSLLLLKARIGKGKQLEQNRLLGTTGSTVFCSLKNSAVASFKKKGAW